MNLPNGLQQATRRDNGPARVIARIHDAAKQLSQYTEPKILVLVNDELVLDVQDLEEAYCGFLDYGSDDTGGYRNTRFKVLSEERIGTQKYSIDLYFWLDRLKGVISGRPSDARPFIRFGSPAGFQLATKFFGASEARYRA